MKLDRQPLSIVAGAGWSGWSWTAVTAGMVIAAQIADAAQAVASRA